MECGAVARRSPYPVHVFVDRMNRTLVDECFRITRPWQGALHPRFTWNGLGLFAACSD